MTQQAVPGPTNDVAAATRDAETIGKPVAAGATREGATSTAPQTLSQQAAAGLLGRSLCNEHSIAPVNYDDHVITIATATPLDKDVEKRIRQRCGGALIRTEVATRAAILEKLQRLFPADTGETLSPKLEKALQQALDLRAEEVVLQPSAVGDKDHGGRMYIVASGAEQAHIRFGGEEFSNLLMTVGQRAFGKYEPKKKQRGHLTAVVDGRPVFCRVLAVPTTNVRGEIRAHIQLRVLRPHYLVPTLGQFGFAPWQEDLLSSAIYRAGVNTAIAAPPGNAKTSLAYRLIINLAQTIGQIFTLEYPAEIFLDGITQMHIGPDFSLEDGLEETLGLSPSLVFIGESLTADTTVQSVRAMTSGIPTLTCLHAPDAASIPYRIVRHGISPDGAANVNLLVATRLVPVLCEKCAMDSVPNETMRSVLSHFPKLQQIAPKQRHRTSGKDACTHCGGSGITGRTGVGEAYLLDGPGAEMVREERWLDLRARIAAQGDSLVEHALKRYAKGQLDVFDFLRSIPVTQYTNDTMAPQALVDGQAASASAKEHVA